MISFLFQSFCRKCVTGVPFLLVVCIASAHLMLCELVHYQSLLCILPQVQWPRGNKEVSNGLIVDLGTVCVCTNSVCVECVCAIQC